MALLSPVEKKYVSQVQQFLQAPFNLFLPLNWIPLRDENEAVLRLPKNNIQWQQAKEQCLQGS